MIYHMTAFFAGFLLDLLFGDPPWLPHPIRLIGKLISCLEQSLRSGAEKKAAGIQREEFERRQGRRLVIMVLMLTGMTVLVILVFAYRIHPYAGCFLETLITYQILATKCLKKESMKVHDKLENGDLKEARTAVSMIVGRDTQALDETGVAKAAIETVAENTSDGVIAPMLCLAVGGPVFGMLYKAVNTMDSMVGYKNETYLHFGRAAAKLDDAVNFLPARISAYLMMAACFLEGKQFDGKRAYGIYQRDKKNHASPNSAHTEAVCAGALGIRLAGDASYFGKIVKKPWIGDDLRPVVYEDIRRVNRLLYGTAFLCETICLLGLFCVFLAGW